MRLLKRFYWILFNLINYIMKKSALLAVLAAIALSACSSFGSKDKAAESNAPEVTAPAAETPAAQ